MYYTGQAANIWILKTDGVHSCRNRWTSWQLIISWHLEIYYELTLVLCYIQQLRAQVPVLKKAVLDEQANEEQLKVIYTETKFWKARCVFNFDVLWMSVNHNICVYKDTEYAHIQCLSGFCSDHCMLVITSTVAQLTSCFCFRMSWKRKILQFGNSNRRLTACLFVTISCPCVSVFCSRNWTRHMLAARNTRSEDGCFFELISVKESSSYYAEYQCV